LLISGFIRWRFIGSNALFSPGGISIAAKQSSLRQRHCSLRMDDEQFRFRPYHLGSFWSLSMFDNHQFIDRSA
jgi:hypothetical protein